MKMRLVTIGILTAAALGACATAVWSEITVDDVKKIAAVLRPYQLMSGQATTTEFEVIFVLDNNEKKLVVLKYDFVRKGLYPIGGRVLPSDFNSGGEGGPYSMASTQISGAAGLLYVTDAATHRALVYMVDVGNNSVTPQQPIDLKQLFSQ